MFGRRAAHHAFSGMSEEINRASNAPQPPADVEDYATAPGPAEQPAFDTESIVTSDLDPMSPPSTVQSSRSQTPDNIEIDTSFSLARQLENVDLDCRCFTPDVLEPRPQVLHINDLPIDVMQTVFQCLTSIADTLAFMLVQRRWFDLSLPQVWHKPAVASRSAYENLFAVLKTPQSEQLYPYGRLISRLNLAALGKVITDDDVAALQHCTGLKRLVLAHCRQISPRVLESAVAAMQDLMVLDFDNVMIDDAFLEVLTLSCPELQVFSVTSDLITDEGLLKLTRLGSSLRRIKLKGCKQITPRGVLGLTIKCARLLELDVVDLACFSIDVTSPESVDHQQLNGFTDDDVHQILRRCEWLRSLKLNASPRVTDDVLSLNRVLLVPRFDNLREIHMSFSTLLTDAGVLQITKAAPRLKLLNLSRSIGITDRSLEHIARAYGATLEYLHVGHCVSITDKGVIGISRQCHKLWFFDAANCANLTDHSVTQLANLPGLRRIGVVKCKNVTDNSVLAIARGLPNIERLHFSYCGSISLLAITRLLDRCRRIGHLSLTGVQAFMSSEFKKFARPPPEDITPQQLEMFCVFSHSGVAELRKHLLNLFVTPREFHPRGAAERHFFSDLQLDHPEMRDRVEAAELAWLREQYLNDPGEMQRRLRHPLPQYFHTREVPWANPTMLPIRDGLIRFSARDIRDRDELGHWPQSMRRNTGHTPGVINDHRIGRRGPLAEVMPRRTFTAFGHFIPDDPVESVSESAQASSGDERGEPPNIELPAPENVGEVRSLTSIAEYRQARFQLRFRPRSAPVPAGPAADSTSDEPASAAPVPPLHTSIALAPAAPAPTESDGAAAEVGATGAEAGAEAGATAEPASTPAADAAAENAAIEGAPAGGAVDSAPTGPLEGTALPPR